MKNGRSKIILILAVLLLIGGIGFYLVENGYFNFDSGEQITYEKNSLYFVTVSNKLYGINKSDGTQVLECKYKTLLRTGNSVYINDGTESYVFFLDSNKSISLGGKETDVNLVYDKNTGKILPYFVLTYGTGKSSVFRIYTDQGVRYNNKDFTSLADVTTFLDAKVEFKPISMPKELAEKYSAKATLSYPTQQMRSQYIVTEKNAKEQKFGIVDETGRIVLDLACENITELVGETKGVIVSRNEKTYLFFRNEKLEEVDSGFEFVSGNRYIYQKKGNTVNKVYNLEGETLIDGIYDYTKDFYSFSTLDDNTYLFVNVDKKFDLYNVNTNQKYQKQYTDVSVKYLADYYKQTRNVWATGYIYISNGIPYCVDFSTMKDSRMNVVTEIYSVLDIGFKYKI